MHRPPKNFIEIFNQQQNAREEVINPNYLRLIDSKLTAPKKHPNERVQQLCTHIHDGFDLINDTFKGQTHSIYGELSRLFKESQQIFEEIKVRDDSEKAVWHLLLRDKFQEIHNKSDELANTKMLLAATASVQPVTRYRFDHLNAAQMVQMSEVINYVKLDLAKRIKELESIEPKISSTLHKELESKKQLLDQLSEAVIDDIKFRIEREKQPMQSLENSFQNIPDPKDSSLKLPVPELPFSHAEKQFDCIEDYLLVFVYKNGGEAGKRWAEQQEGFYNRKSILEKLSDKLYYQFDPETNPYVGITVDFANFTWLNLGRPIYDIVKSNIDALRGNWIAQDILRIRDQIQGNKNFQKIEGDLAKKRLELDQFYEDAKKYFSEFFSGMHNPTEPLKVDVNDSQLMRSWFEVEVPVDYENLSKELKGLEDALKKMQERLANEIKTAEAEYQKLKQDWVMVFEDESSENASLFDSIFPKEDEEKVDSTGHGSSLFDSLDFPGSQPPAQVQAHPKTQVENEEEEEKEEEIKVLTDNGIPKKKVEEDKVKLETEEDLNEQQRKEVEAKRLRLQQSKKKFRFAYDKDIQTTITIERDPDKGSRKKCSIEEIEQQYFDEALEQLNDDLKNGAETWWYPIVKEVVDEINAAKADPNNSVMTPVYTRALVAVKEAKDQPSPATASKLLDVADEIGGQNQRIARGLALIAGVSLIFFAVGLAVSTFGTGAPVSALMSTLGVLMVASAVLGISMTAVSARLFSKACEPKPGEEKLIELEEMVRAQPTIAVK